MDGPYTLRQQLVIDLAHCPTCFAAQGHPCVELAPRRACWTPRQANHLSRCRAAAQRRRTWRSRAKAAT
jgi:hypothetical protein